MPGIILCVVQIQFPSLLLELQTKTKYNHGTNANNPKRKLNELFVDLVGEKLA